MPPISLSPPVPWPWFHKFLVTWKNNQEQHPPMSWRTGQSALGQMPSSPLYPHGGTGGGLASCLLLLTKWTGSSLCGTDGGAWCWDTAPGLVSSHMTSSWKDRILLPLSGWFWWGACFLELAVSLTQPAALGSSWISFTANRANSYHQAGANELSLVFLC
jgi:hypothetical protein